MGHLILHISDTMERGGRFLVKMENRFIMIFLVMVFSINFISAWCIFGFGTTCGKEIINIKPTLNITGVSELQFKDNDLNINTTLKKMDFKSFIEPVGDVWVKGLKFGFNDTVANEDGLYQYEWISNKEIRISEKGYYYFEEYYVGETGVSKIYSRRSLDVSDVCSFTFDTETNTTNNPACIYHLESFYGVNNTLLYSKLLLNFTGFYNETLGMVFIDPSFSYTNVSEEATLVTNVRSEAPFSHLSTAFNESLVLYMPMDYNASTPATDLVYDYTDNNNDGVKVGFADNYTRAGYIGGGYEFDGAEGNCMNLGNDGSLDITQEITIVAWAKQNKQTSQQQVVSKYDGAPSVDDSYFLRFDGNDLDFHIRNSTGDGGNTASFNNQFSIDTWYQVAGTFNGTHIIPYINGVAGTPNVIPLDTIRSSPNENTHVGSENDCGGVYNGSIDEVMIFNRSLSAFEIGQLYNYTFQKFYKDGNQTFNLTEVSLGNDNRVNLTVKGQALNDSKLSARVYEANLTDSSNPSVSYINTDVSTDNSLVGYWHFDNWSSYGENSTHVFDFSGNENNGTWNGGGQSNGTAKYGNWSGEFDGVDDGVRITDSSSLDITGDITIALWIYPQDITAEGSRLFHKNSAYSLHQNVGSNADLRFFNYADNSDGLSTASFTNDEWQLVTVVKNGITVNFYRNGVDVSQDTIITSTMPNSAVDVYIGLDEDGTSFPFNGLIDEVMIFNRFLLVQEVKSLYLTGSTNHINNGVGINWTESSSGVQELAEINSTHRNATFVVQTSSEFLLPEINFNSTNGFYSSILEKVVVDTYFIGGEEPPSSCASLDSGEWYVPAGCECYCESESLNLNECSCPV